MEFKNIGVNEKNNWLDDKIAVFSFFKKKDKQKWILIKIKIWKMG